MAEKMLFNSWEFLLFFPIVLAVFYGLPHTHQWKWLLLTSCIFYMAFIPYYLLILLLIIVIDYLAAIYIESHYGRARYIGLAISVLVTCLVLFFFKYFNFAAKNLNWLSTYWGLNFSIDYLNIILPLGLSFHTFQSLSYTIEVYRGNQKAERHFGIYALYVMFFPQLVAGPIERPQNMLHQFHAKNEFNEASFKSGLILLLWGLFKKVVIADSLATYVNPVFQDPSQFSSGSVIVAIVFFYFQIYCDFSGYTDIARGSARMLGFELMKNFNIPFMSISLTDFWKRWHISLSTWLRDYIYEPLALRWRDAGIIGIAIALILTFLISGIWHGAEWTFLIWGFGHGIALAIELICSKIFKVKNRIFPKEIGEIFGIFRTFILICVSYIFFRAQNLDNAVEIFRKIFISIPDLRSYIEGFKFINLSQVTIINHTFGDFLTAIFFIFGLIIIEKAHADGALMPAFRRLPRYFQIMLYQIFLIVLIVYGVWFTKHASFIYFQF
jgi:D-alanyl-lipoteichoic acid acyltransferase DltB (MBOAT superfamily)